MALVNYNTPDTEYDHPDDDDPIATPKYISEKRLYEIVGFISAELAHRSGAYDGNAPTWFPEPPEWISILEDAVTATHFDSNHLVGETDATVWADAWLDIVHSNPTIPYDWNTMVGWFANAIGSGEMAEQRAERERREHPLYYLDLRDPETHAVVLEEIMTAIFVVSPEGEVEQVSLG